MILADMVEQLGISVGAGSCVGPREFSEIFTSTSEVSSLRFLKSGKEPEVDLLVVDPDTRLIPARPRIDVDAFHRALTGVDPVLSLTSQTQIADAIVAGNEVLVVHDLLGPDTMREVPSQSMRAVIAATKTDDDVSTGANRPGYTALEGAQGRALDPVEQPGLGLVSKVVTDGGRGAAHSVSPSSIYGLLVSQGIANGRAGTRANGGMKMRGAAIDGAHSRVAAGEDSADLNSERDRANVSPAKFTVLTCNMAQHAHGRRKQATNAHLRLVWSN